MSSPEVLLQVLRAEMRAAGLTYKALGAKLDLSESSVKRMFSQGDMSLTRMAQVCAAVGVPMEDVLRQAADNTPHADTLTLEQEKSLVSDPKLLLVAISCLGHWSLEQIVETYAISEAECIGYLVKLDRLALIELKPGNRFRMRVSVAFRWLPDGPVQHFFRQAVVDDYFAGRFDGAGEALLCVNARLSDASAMDLVQKIRQLAAELAKLHQNDQRLPLRERDGFTLMLGFRSWEFKGLTALRRKT
ncbi:MULTISPECIES: helix-turn-helix domain-containing protein [unclassified Roseateles]|uniref:helix-turn-helix domain-containing protein n=1 Tax=unclassified Roseateles TaxID=2626991 RepID=UPI000733C50B|nr:helix-turn-helix domain-containing protein [Paucibacter sp. KCTC 42545]ALT77734.1 Cro/Cl family transcriptional regulator [Paucibacter sp. KCTC 42545]MBY0236751.1 helix-turn-helix transcriptional regulator [Burkholderiaceae bacterium]